MVSTIRCTGSEERLEDCQLEKTDTSPGKATCSRANAVAGIICDESKQLLKLLKPVFDPTNKVFTQQRTHYLASFSVTLVQYFTQTSPKNVDISVLFYSMLVLRKTSTIHVLKESLLKSFF